MNRREKNEMIATAQMQMRKDMGTIYRYSYLYGDEEDAHLGSCQGISSTGFVVAVLFVGIVCAAWFAAVGGESGAWGAIACIITTIWIVCYGLQPGMSLEEAYEIRHKKQIELYGMTPKTEWNIGVEVLKAAFSNNTDAKYDELNAPMIIQMKPLDVKSIVVQNDYDYTDLFVELAYRHIVTCFRMGVVPYVSNFFDVCRYTLNVYGGDLPYGCCDFRFSTNENRSKYQEIPVTRHSKERLEYLCEYEYERLGEPGNEYEKIWKYAYEKVDDKAPNLSNLLPYSDHFGSQCRKHAGVESENTAKIASRVKEEAQKKRGY